LIPVALGFIQWGLIVDEQKISDEVQWLGVIGRAAAVLALHAAELSARELTVQAEFLERLGLARRETAKILGTTEDSLRVLRNRAVKAKTKTASSSKPRKQGKKRANRK
jgi:hypothetical protein